MSRNGSGSYTLPASVNPVVDGTAITITWANTTLDDVATALTDSLDRNGKGGMLAPLRTADGSVAAPSYSFTADPDSGLYRAGANDVRVGVGSQSIGKWTTAGYEVTGTCSASSAFRAPDGAVDAPGYAFTLEPGSGLYRAGAGDVRLSVSETDVVKATSTGIEVSGTIASKKITATGAADVAGGEFANGTAATAAVRRTACKLANGDLDLDGVPNPNSNVGLKNKLTPASIAKAWAWIRTDGAGGAAVLGGMNIASVAVDGGAAFVVITLAEPISDPDKSALVAQQYNALGSPQPVEDYAAGWSPVVPPAYEVRVSGAQTTFPPTVMSAINFATSIRLFYVIVFGHQ